MATSVDQDQIPERGIAAQLGSRLGGKVPLYLLLFILAFIALGPFVYAALSAFKTADKVLEYPPSLIPHPWTGSNFTDLFNKGGSDVHFSRWLLNSFIYAVSICSLNVLFSSMAAYALARLKFFGSNIWFVVTLAVMMIPGEINWISRYIILNHFGLPFSIFGHSLTLNLIDTYWAIIVVFAAHQPDPGGRYVQHGTHGDHLLCVPTLLHPGRRDQWARRALARSEDNCRSETMGQGSG